MVRLLPLASMLLLAACNNPCQALCVEMAEYARECGYDATAEDVQSCNDEYAGPNLAEGDAEACIEASDPQQLREWWTCEQLLDNYQSGAN
ncbi:MAG: hypothetical protein Q8P41_16915 [Pseudomonadota bacterium]|nr:hypothetical protein [Pseudomonadota bacterium]